MKWYEIEPKNAIGIDLTKRPDLDGPWIEHDLREEYGNVCPWPWEPQQKIGVGQYHCGYCGSMVLGGERHPDYREVSRITNEDGEQNE